MKSGEENAPAASDSDLASLLSLELELAPAWAKKAPDAHHQRYADDPRGGADDSRRSGSSRDFRRDRPAGGSRDRLPLEIRVLPDQKALGAVIRKIQSSHRAYPLRDIARLFLDNDAAYQIRIEPAKDAVLPLFQCKVCQLPALSEEEIRTHVLTTHLADFFDASEIETEPPAGNFVCVARCGLSGELLGPPNHHSYSARVQEMLRTRYAHMSPEAYRARIEMVRDPEAVSQWRESCRKKTVYRRKRPDAPAPEAAPAADAAAPAEAENAPAAETELALGPPMERAAAELVFQREILPEQIVAAKHLVCLASAVRRTPSHRLLEAVRETMNRELRFPASLFFALRGAFRHRSLHLFRANHERGQEFVVVRAPAALDASHVVADLGVVLEHINQHPGCTRPELLAALANGDEARAAHLATQLNTLVEKAHVIEFYNGILCPPQEYPAFRYLPGERDNGQRPAEGRKPAAGNQRPAASDQKPDAAGSQPEAEVQPPPEAVEPPAAEPLPEVAASAEPEAAPEAPAADPAAAPA